MQTPELGSDATAGNSWMKSTESDQYAEWLARKHRDRQRGDYRAFVGPEELYDVVGAMQFNLLTHLGLREEHYLLDVGCGSLRSGRLFIPYLLPGHYCGIEPEAWLIDAGIKCELGEEIQRVKLPRFSSEDEFTLSLFGQMFDFIIAHSIFSHASVGQIRRCLTEARTVMRPNSIFVATFVRGTECYDGDEWVSCAPYTLEHMVEITRENGLDCQPIDWHHPTGQQWLFLTTRES